jgi:23S rRNA pseudouridine2604 synthase
MMTEPVRLNKRMAELALCSRREADDWIARGWVLVNGAPAVMGVKVLPSDKIEVDQRATGAQAQLVTVLLHKPVGYVSGQPEDGYEPAIVLVNPRFHWIGDPTKIHFQGGHLKSLAPSGRLDIDSTGLLVLTQDGRVARQLIGEDSDMEKEYLVRVSYQVAPQRVTEMPGAATHGRPEPISQDVRAVFPPAMLARLRHGLSLDGQALRPAQVDWQNPEQLRFVLKEGKKRQIRRMCEAVGLHVTGLKRVRIGNVALGQLPVGQWRYLAAHERF